MNILLNGDPNYEDYEDRNFEQLQLDPINDKWKVNRMISDFDFGISVFVGLVSIALSYYCIRDKSQYRREVNPKPDYINIFRNK